MSSKKEKQFRRKASFKAFGTFLTSHMMRKFGRTKQGKTKTLTDSDSLEAGFIDQNGSSSMLSANGRGGINGIAGYNSSSEDKNYTPGDNTSLSGKATHSTGIDSSFSAPGVCGLVNHGATCYINAIVQCLSNTDLLAEYFVMGQYKADLKNARRERSKKYGTNGELAEQLAVVIKSLWTNQYNTSMTKDLKEVMCKYAPQYKGNEQHDSQEFLLWLFDKIHEDLNIQPIKKTFFSTRASIRKKSKKRLNENKGSDQNTNSSQLDTVPTSFVQKVFQAHFRSTLTCPNCKRQSHTTDPFLCVSLPITQRTTRPVYVTVSYVMSKKRGESRRKHHAPRTVQIGVAVSLDGKILQLRQAVAAECGIHSRLLAFSELSDGGFGTSYGDDKPLSDIPQVAPTSSTLHAFEMPAPMKMTAGTLPRNFASRHKKRASIGNGESLSKDGLTSTTAIATVPKNVVVVVVNRKMDGKQGKLFGRPLVFHVSKEVYGSDLRALIFSKMTEFIRKGVEDDKLTAALRLQVVDGIQTKPYISNKTQQPLLLPTVETALDNCPAGGPLHVKLVAEWDSDLVDDMFENLHEEAVEEHESVRLQRLLHQQPVTCSLQECFELLTKDEELGSEDAWDCPHCHKQRYGTLKKLSLYTLPDVLVVHLKRFRVVNDKRTKLNTRVEFPISGLDMSPYLLDSHQPKVTQNGRGLTNRLNGLKSIGGFPSRPEDSLYDLYAVCNHFGNLNSGHYTAGCLNPLDGQWYLFDDKRTELISEENLSQQSVYILFYQRRSSNPASVCGGGSVSSLMMSDHWALSLPQAHRQKASSQSHLNQYAVNAVVKPVNGSAKHLNSNNSNNNAKKTDFPATRRLSSSYDSHKKGKEEEKKKKNKKPHTEDVFRDSEMRPSRDDAHQPSEQRTGRGNLEEHHSFVRGLPRQQSVPRSTSKSEKPAVNTRRLSERYMRQRPSSHYEPFIDTYKKYTHV